MFEHQERAADQIQLTQIIGSITKGFGENNNKKGRRNEKKRRRRRIKCYQTEVKYLSSNRISDSSSDKISSKSDGGCGVKGKTCKQIISCAS